jgi:hypothetical protein
MIQLKSPIITIDTGKKSGFRLPSANINDAKKVQPGGQGPVFRTSSIVDKSKVRLGGQGPIFRR